MRGGPLERLRGIATAFGHSGDEVPRLALKPPGRVTGQFDGGWWPSSREPVGEFTELVGALAERCGDIRRIGFHAPSWDLAPDRLVVGDQSVRLWGFHALNRFTVIVIGSVSAHRLVLLVVPPTAAPAAALTALRLAATPGDTGDAEDILTDAGIPTR